MIRSCIALATLLAVGSPAFFAAMPVRAADHKPASSIPAAALIQPAALAAQLKDGAGAKPLLLQVGFRKLYDQAHIPGSVYAGPAGTPEGIEVLHTALSDVAHDRSVVLYCGCCPWSRCPNVAAAYDELVSQGFTAVKVLYIAENFGADWVEKGYPVEKP
ncbi:MAG: rhodanese-like domain-containing protein [Steroidobacteraceae bacterium]